MYKALDKVRVVRAEGVRWLRVGAILEVAQDQPRNAEFIRVIRPFEMECVIRADRVEMHEQHPNNAPAVVPPRPAPQPAAAAPAAPLKVPGVFAVGDRVVVARGEQPNHAYGINHEMRAAVGQGIIFTIRNYVRGGNRGVEFEEDDSWCWDIRMLDHAPGVPVAAVPEAQAAVAQAAIIAPVVKRGRIAREDLVPGMLMLFMGDGTDPRTGNALVGEIYEFVKHFPGVDTALYFKLPGGPDAGAAGYANNFHYIPSEMLEIQVGSVVEVIVPYENLRMGRQLVVTNTYVNRDGSKLVGFGDGRKWRESRFKLLRVAEPAPEPLPDNIPEHELTVAAPFKAGDKVKIFQKVEVRNSWRYGDQAKIHAEGRARIIKSINRYGTVILEGDRSEFDVGCFIKPVPIPEDADFRKRFAMAEGGYWHGSLCSFAYKQKDQADTFRFTGPCHQNLFSPRIQEIVIGTVAMAAQADSLEDIKTYHNYLANVSPWAKCFVTKDVEEAYREGGFIMNTDEPKSHVVGACIAARAGHEHSRRLSTFLHLLEKGHHGNTAFMLSLKLAFDKEEGTFSEIETPGGHDCITSSLENECMLHFFTKGFPDQGDKPCKEDAGGYVVHAKIDPRAGHPARNSFGSAIMAQLKTEQVGEGWEKETVVQTESVYALADKLDKLIKEQA